MLVLGMRKGGGGVPLEIRREETARLNVPVGIQYGGLAWESKDEEGRGGGRSRGGRGGGVILDPCPPLPLRVPVPPVCGVEDGMRLA